MAKDSKQCLCIGRQKCVVVSSFEAIREVMVTKASHFAHRPNLVRFDAIFRGDRQLSVALCDWSEKQRQRREVTFPFTHPRGAASLLASAIENELVRLVDVLHSEKRDASEALLTSCANQFYLFFCGIRFDEKDEAFQRVVANYGELFRSLFNGHAIDFLPWARWFGGRRHLQRLSELSLQVSHFTDPLVNISSRSPLLVDLLMKDARLPAKEAQIVIEDLMGGHTVLHNMVLWALAFVAHHPHIQEKLRGEAEEATGGKRLPLLLDRPQLRFAEATVLEVLRVISSPVIPHRSTQDTSIQGYEVGKDTLVFFNMADLNRDPTLWKDPLEFNPQRFLDADGLPTKPDYFLPFGTGKRSCLGDCIVKASLLLTLSSLALCFHIRLGPGQQPPPIEDMPDLLIWPAQTMQLSFTPRA